MIGQTLKIHSMDKMDDLIGILSSEIRVRNFSQLSNQSYKYLPLTYLVNEIHDDICAGYSTENVYNLCSTCKSSVTIILFKDIISSTTRHQSWPVAVPLAKRSTAFPRRFKSGHKLCHQIGHKDRCSFQKAS